MLDKRAWIDGRIDSLAAHPETIEDAAPVILFGAEDASLE